MPQTIQPGNASTAMVLYPNGSNGEVKVYPVHKGDGRPSQVGTSTFHSYPLDPIDWSASLSQGLTCCSPSAGNVRS